MPFTSSPEYCLKSLYLESSPREAFTSSPSFRLRSIVSSLVAGNRSVTLLEGPSSFSFPLSLTSSFLFFGVETVLEEDEEEVGEVDGAGLDGRAELATT